MHTVGLTRPRPQDRHHPGLAVLPDGLRILLLLDRLDGQLPLDCDTPNALAFWRAMFLSPAPVAPQIVLRFVSDIMMGAFEVLADLILPENWTSNDAQTVKMTLAVSVPAFLIAYCLVHATPHPKTGRRMFTYAGSFIIYTLLPMITIPGAPKLLITPIFPDFFRFFPVFPWTSGRVLWIPGVQTLKMGEKWGKMGKKWVKKIITGVEKRVLMHASARLGRPAGAGRAGLRGSEGKHGLPPRLRRGARGDARAAARGRVQDNADG